MASEFAWKYVDGIYLVHEVSGTYYQLKVVDFTEANTANVIRCIDHQGKDRKFVRSNIAELKWLYTNADGVRKFHRLADCHPNVLTERELDDQLVTFTTNTDPLLLLRLYKHL